MSQETPIQLNTRNEHHCFGCGTLNPHGLRLAFYSSPDDGRVWADFTPDRRHEGYHGLVHGGIIAALLDETLGWSFFGRGIWAVTTRLNLIYRQPVPVGQPVRVSAWLVRDRGRVLEAAGRIDDLRGDTLVEAEGAFMRVPESRRQEWEAQYGNAEPGVWNAE